MEWADEYWLIHKPYNYSPDTAKQYLSLDQRYKPIDGTNPLNTIIDVKSTHFEIEDKAHEFVEKAITLEQFKEMDIDIIIASIPDHWVSFKKLRDKYKPKAKLICQMGNIFWENETLIRNGEVENLLASVKPFKISQKVNAVWYHQEMKIIDFVSSPSLGKIYSFVNCLPNPELFKQYKEALSEYTVKAYGASCPDGWVNGIDAQYKGMQEADWGYHVKPFGDGMGHIWHSWFMLGRPVITNFSDYKDKLGGLLFEHLKTGIDLEQNNFEDNLKLIRTLNYKQMGIEARKRFFEIVNYDEEEIIIRKFIENLI